MKRKTPLLIPTETLEKERLAALEIAAMPGRPSRYFLITYGCQMNAHDSQHLAGMLEQMGMLRAETREEADLILFNTCCIRDNAERKALGNMTWLKQLKQKRPGLVLCVSGCMMQQPKMAQIMLRRYPFFDVALGTHNLYHFPSLLLRALETRRQIVEVTEGEGAIAEGLPIVRDNPYTAFLTVMYGCDNFCSYCVVPYVRGRERSRAPGTVLREAEALLSGGVQEITLLGQNVNSYGNDLTGDASFPALLQSLNALGVPRIRFMTSHPKDLSDALIRAMADLPRVAGHLHLPAQSGSDRVLAAMNRGYTRAKYLERVSALRAASPDIGLTTDLIVAFPGETETDFADTLSLVETVRFDSAYTFVFSPRDGTRAARMENGVPADVAADRIARLIAAQERVTAAHYQALIGTNQRVLAVETARRGARQISGKCARNITINFEGEPEELGRFTDVTVTAAGHNTLKGKPVREKE